MKNASMWRILTVMLLMAGLTASARAEVAEMAPEDTEILIRIPGVETLFDLFSVTENAILGQPIEDIDEAKEELGFNPLKISELKSRGLDVKKPFGLLIDSLKLSEDADEPSFNAALFLPVTDADKAMEAVKTMISKEAPDLEWSGDGDLTVFKGAEGGNPGYLLAKAGYLFIGGAPKTDAKPFMERIAKAEKGLTADKSYKEVAGQLPSDREIFAYADAARVVEGNLAAIKKLSKESAEEAPGPDMTKNLDYLKEWTGAGAGIDFDTKDLMVDTVINVMEGAESLAVVKDVRFDKGIVMGIKDAPVLLVSFAVNARKYYDMVMASLADEQRQSFQRNLKGIKEGFGVDLESDIIDNLAGNLNLGLYDGMTINMANYNTLLTLNLKDGDKMEGVIEKVIARLPPEQQSMVVKTTVGTQESYMVSLMGMTQLFLGVKENNLIVALGKPMYEKALAADMKTGFLANMKDPGLVETLKSDAASVFYLDSQETFKALKNFSAMLQQFSKDPSKPIIDEKVTNAVNQFDYLLSSSEVRGNSIFSNLMVKTNFVDSFFQGVRNVAESFKETPSSESEAGTSK